MTEQPRELFYLCIVFMFTSNFIWSTRIALELKIVFFSVLFFMVFAFMFVFLELDKLRMEKV